MSEHTPESGEIEDVAAQCQAWALHRFDTYGPHDARGAALWDVAAWLRERPTVCPHPYKRAHTNEADAQRQLQSLIDNPARAHTDRLHHYLCTCGCWHVGSRASGVHSTPASTSAEEA